MEILVKAHAKINLSLDVLRKRDDGYHDLEMVMTSLALCDDISIRITEGSQITASSNVPFLPSDQKNIAVLAAMRFFQALNLPPQQVEIYMHKRIPVAAGLAGGSADAAAVLKGLNALLDTKCSPSQLAEIGGSLGSDVTYCLTGGTMFAQGKGEILSPLPPLPPCHIVLSRPAFSIKTPELFGQIQPKKIVHRPDTQGLIKALFTGDLSTTSHYMYNVFEDVLDSRGEAVSHIKNTLLDQGAQGALMTGTGPCVFGLFAEEEAAQKAYHLLKEKNSATFLTQVFDQSNG